jgi:hypothetical protein
MPVKILSNDFTKGIYYPNNEMIDSEGVPFDFSKEKQETERFWREEQNENNND